MVHENGRRASVLAAWMMLLLVGMAARARGEAALLVEEPFGRFGGMNPTGHAAVYFNRVCADGPTRLRLCRPGELGVVVSRYHKINGYDWMAMPIVPYLYAVDEAEQVPSVATPAIEAELRDRYRRRHLEGVAPDLATGAAPDGEWIQLVGSSYDRTIHGFAFRTTLAQDERLIAEFNDRRNVSHFNLFFNNCADLARHIVNGYYPHVIHRNYVADVGFTTPKQEAKLLMHYGQKHPEMELRAFVIPQVPGTIERSTKVRGVLESLVKQKRYLVPLAYLYPEVTGGMALAYLGGGRFRFPEDEQAWTLADLVPGVPLDRGAQQAAAITDVSVERTPRETEAPSTETEETPSTVDPALAGSADGTL